MKLSLSCSVFVLATSLALAKPPDLPMDVHINCELEPKSAAADSAIEAQELEDPGRNLDDVLDHLEDLCDQVWDCATGWWLPQLVVPCGAESTHGLQVAALRWPVEECPDAVEPTVTDVTAKTKVKESRGCCGRTQCDDMIANLKRIEQARSWLMQAERLNQNGCLEAACELYERVCRVCPGSRYAAFAMSRLGQTKAVLSGRTKSGAETCEGPDGVRRLDLPILLNFDNVPLRDVLAGIQEITGVRVVTEGIDDETLNRPMTFRVQNLPLRCVFRLLLDHTGLRHAIQDRQVLITKAHSPSRVSVLRVYTVGDLIHGPEADVKSEEFRKFLMTMVSPSTWQGQGGSGTIGCQAGLLIVMQTEPVHRQIGEVVACLRKVRGAESSAEEQERGGREERVDHILKACHKAMECGDIESDKCLARKAIALDPKSVAAHPLVYRAMLLERCKANRAAEGKGVMIIQVIEESGDAEEQEAPVRMKKIRRLYIAPPAKNLEVK